MDAASRHPLCRPTTRRDFSDRQWNFGKRLVGGGPDEFFELPVGYRGAVDPKAVETDPVDWRFFRIMLIRTHSEPTARYPNHVRRRRLLCTLHCERTLTHERPRIATLR